MTKVPKILFLPKNLIAVPRNCRVSRPVVRVFTFSKTYGMMVGARLCHSDARNIREMLEGERCVSDLAPVVSQYAPLYALEYGVCHIAAFRSAFKNA